MQIVTYTHFHMFCGSGGGAKGFNRGSAKLGPLEARFRCLGGVDVDTAAVKDFTRLAGVPGTVLDLFDVEDYEAFHGSPPPAGWRPAMPDDIRGAAGNECPDLLFLSAPCKGNSGLLPEARAKTGKYQALNRLALRGIMLALDAFADNPPAFILFENVPRIAQRSRDLLDQITALLHAAGYAIAETTHDCGVIGGLAQSRKRFLMVARHMGKVPPFLYEPPQRRLRGVGEILEKMPLPGDPVAGPMHRIPRLTWKTWVRLAFVKAGSDWRSLQGLRVVDGVLADYAIEPERPYFSDALGVVPWDRHAGTVTSEGRPHNGAFAVADPRRAEGRGEYGQYGVTNWDETSQAVTGKAAVGAGRFAVADPRPPVPSDRGNYGVAGWHDQSGTITSQRSPGQGKFSVADPRIDQDGGARFNNVFRVVEWKDPAPAVTAGSGPSSGGNAVADPRVGYGTGSHQNKFAVMPWDETARTVTGATQVQGGALSVADPRCPSDRDGSGKYRVTGYEEPAGVVIAASTTGQGAFAVADPRPAGLDPDRGAYLSGGHYGVLPWSSPSGAVTGSACHDNGPWSVADPRGLPAPNTQLVAVIRALDGTWHRPFTTLELAALQSLVDPEEQFMLEGASDSGWRERIGNAVPPDAAAAIAGVMGRALLLASTGATFALSMEPIWVRPVAIAIRVARGAAA